jgi:hypothetical protein
MTSAGPIEDFPLPASNLQIEGDPTLWGLHETGTPTPRWVTAGDPVALAVITPLEGTLLLAPRRAASFLLYPLPLLPGGWVPCIKLQSPYLYLPSTTGVAADSPGYRLAPGANLEQLQRDILAAMSTGDLLPVTVSIGTGHGTVVLNGAQLPFVVLARAERA